MTDFDITVDTDYIASWGALELPISGPASANTLVVLTGNAFIGLQFLVRTGYFVTPPDRYRDVAGDGRIQQTTHVTLAHGDGDDTDMALLGVEAADTYIDDRYTNTNSRPPGEVVVRMLLAIKGDCTLDAVAYQVHLLLHKRAPQLWGEHPTPTGEVGIGEAG